MDKLIGERRKVSDLWQSMESAPQDGTPIEVVIPGNGKDSIVRWDNRLDSWVFAEDQEPPQDWTDGVCWVVNGEGNQSTRPVSWRPINNRFYMGEET